MTRPRIAITAGEPAGIGPELVALLALRHRERPFAARLVVLGDRDAARRRARRASALAPRYADYDRRVVRAGRRRRRSLAPARRGAGRRPGSPIPTNAHSVLAHAAARVATPAPPARSPRWSPRRCRRACCMDAGIPFAGHTEFFAAAHAHAARRDAARRRRAGRAAARRARHDAPRAEGRARPRSRATRSTRRSRSSARELAREVRHRRAAHRRLRPQSARRRGRAPRPRGDRRHRAGDRRRARRGPRRRRARCPPTRCSCPAIARRFDAIVAMYHDQGLPVLKAASFGQRHQRDARPAVHPHVGRSRHRARPRRRRRAGARRADPGSLFAAVDLAIELAGARRRARAR